MPLEHVGVITGMLAIREEREEYYAYHFILLFILEMLNSIISAWIFQQLFFVITQTVLLSYKAVWESKYSKSGKKIALLSWIVQRESLESGSVYLHGPLNSAEIHSIDATYRQRKPENDLHCTTAGTLYSNCAVLPTMMHVFFCTNVNTKTIILLYSFVLLQWSHVLSKTFPTKELRFKLYKLLELLNFWWSQKESNIFIVAFIEKLFGTSQSK